MNITSEQREFWQKNSYLVLKNFFSATELESINRFTTEIKNWPETPGKWMKYFESVPGQKEDTLCRIENFFRFHPQLKGLLLNSKIKSVLSQLFAEEAVLFKEKINFKLAGGGSFKPHQDAPAFSMFKQNYHITYAIPLDAATANNGPLEIARGYPCSHKQFKVLPQNQDGTLTQGVVNDHDWKTLMVNPGDILFFDSYVPHRSGVNNSQAPRRTYYITFNPKSAGDYYLDYYAEKRKFFPPRCEPEVELSPEDKQKASQFNLANPINEN